MLELEAVNKSKQMLIMVGKGRLVGTMQNCLLNTSLMIYTETTMVIPDECVEGSCYSIESEIFAIRRDKINFAVN